jgi:hypothetical protein
MRPLNALPLITVFRSPRTSASDGTAPSISAVIFLSPAALSDSLRLTAPDSMWSCGPVMSDVIVSRRRRFSTCIRACVASVCPSILASTRNESKTVARELSCTSSSPGGATSRPPTSVIASGGLSPILISADPSLTVMVIPEQFTASEARRERIRPSI